MTYKVNICKATQGACINSPLSGNIYKYTTTYGTKYTNYPCGTSLCSGCYGGIKQSVYNFFCEVEDYKKMGFYDKCQSCDHKYMCIFLIWN